MNSGENNNNNNQPSTDMPGLDMPVGVAFPETSVDNLTLWMFDNNMIGMGAERAFDYTGEDTFWTERLGRCYELAAKAFTGWEMIPNQAYIKTALPAPRALIHGTWQGPDTPKPIRHAWVLLTDGRVWEPVSGLICDSILFHAFTDAKPKIAYTGTESRQMMLRHQHFGPWPVIKKGGN